MEKLTLAIDTSCDETSVAVIRGTLALSNLLPSQIEFHKKYGGIVPSIAKLAHQERIDNVVKEAMQRAKVNYEDLDQIAVTLGPGLAIALEVGINKAKEIAEIYKKPLIVINHMEGHLLSGFVQMGELKSEFNPSYPALGLLVSGKHTEIVLVKSLGKYKIIGETLDDACGEAFDKCGRILGFGYPGGPVISKFAKEHRKNMKVEVVRKDQSLLVKSTNLKSNNKYLLPVSMANSGDLNFSYSGLKTAFRDLIGKLGELNEEKIKDLCVAFEAAAFMQIEVKLKKALIQHKPKEIWLGGGVVASAHLRSLVRKIVGKEIIVRTPTTSKLTGDNAAMIGLVANVNNYKPSRLEEIDREPNLTF